jgi:hypothetical protein
MNEIEIIQLHATKAMEFIKRNEGKGGNCKQYFGKTYKEVIGKAEDVLNYHEGKCNGKGMCIFMLISNYIMADKWDMIMGFPQKQHCDDQEALEHT